MRETVQEWLAAWLPISPLWALLPLAILFVYGLMKANYEAFEKIKMRRERERKEPEKANGERRADVASLAKRPRTDAEELKHTCLQLGTELGRRTEQWLAVYRKIEAREPTNEAQRWGKDWDRESILKGARATYEKRFRDRAMKLFELSEERGLAEARWKRFAYNAAGSLRRMQMVAERLVRIGREG